MIFPNKLQLNDLIGIVAPASCEEKSIIDEKLKAISDLGINYKIGKSLYSKYGYLAGTDIERGKDFMDMVKNPSIKAIISFRGGYGSIRMLKYLNLKIIKNNPKIILGYSDLTVLLNYISNKCDLVTYHGPMINSNLNDKKTLKSLKSQLYSNQNDILYTLTEKNEILNFPLGSIPPIYGKLVGGNLSMICSTIGTPYEIDTKDSILLLEDIGESPYKIDRMITQLYLSKKFKSVKAILLGHFTDCEPVNLNRSFSSHETLIKNLKHLNIPIIFNIACGHDYPNCTFPIGAYIKIDLKNNIICIKKHKKSL